MQIRSDIPVVICTGFSRRIDPTISKRIGIKGFLMKPVTRSKLSAMIRAALGEHRKEVENEAEHGKEYGKNYSYVGENQGRI
jgi:DNA-binding NtrC family response regulator